MNTQIEKAPRAQLTIRDRLEGADFKAAVAKALPRHLTPDRFIRVACTAMTKTPKLMQCDQASFFAALLTLSQLGLEPDGRRAHLIPFGDQVQLIIDYKGLAELVMRSGLVSNIHADVVCGNDDFDYDRGQLVKHRINFKEPRGPVYAAYCIVRFKDGSEKCDVMTVDEIEAVRSRSRAGKSGPWVTDWNEMAKKTVFRRLSKWLPLSPEFRDAIEVDEDVAIDIGTSQPFEVEAPKTKPRLGRPPKEEKPDGTGGTAPATSTLPMVETPPPEDLTSAESQTDDGDLGPQPGYAFEITPDLSAKLVELKVSRESLDKWILASERAAAFNADFEAASGKLAGDERALKALQKFHMLNGAE